MEQPNTIFSLSVDPVTKSHLSEAARWAKFLAIAGMVSLVLLVLLGLYMSTLMANNYNSQFNDSATIGTGIGIGMAIVYLIVAIIWFFPLMYLLRFSNNMSSAIVTSNQEELNASFQNLKICFRYLGIVTIIAMAFYILSFIVTIMTTNSFQ